MPERKHVKHETTFLGRTMASSQQKTVVLIAGMHRSGTSALAQALGLAGCRLPKTLMEPLLNSSEKSLKGHSESWVITRLNVEILSRVNHFSVEDVRSPLGTAELSALFGNRAVAVLHNEFGDSRLFVLKDPQLCLLLGFWIDVVRTFGARPIVICPIRDPLEVALSLKARSRTDKRSLVQWIRIKSDYPRLA